MDINTQRSLKDENWEVRFKTIILLGKSKDIRAIDPLLNALKDETEEVRAGAADALGKIGNNRAIQPLIKILSDKSWDVRASAMSALGKIGDPSIVNSILPYLNDQNLIVQKETINTLGELGAKDAINHLKQLLASDNEELKEKVAEVLKKLDWKAESISERIDSAIGNGDWNDLKNIGQPAVDQLIKILINDKDERNIKAAEILGEIQDPNAIKPLIKVCINPFSSSTTGANSTFSKALFKFKDRASDALFDEIKKHDDDSQEFPTILNYLILLKDKRAIDLIIQREKKDRLKPAMNPEDRRRHRRWLKGDLEELGVDTKIVTCAKCKKEFDMQTNGDVYIQRIPWPSRLFCPHCGYLIAFYNNTEENSSYDYEYWHWHKDNDDLNFYRCFPNTDPRFVYFRHSVPVEASIQPGRDQIDLNLIRKIESTEKR